MFFLWVLVFSLNAGSFAAQVATEESMWPFAISKESLAKDKKIPGISTKAKEALRKFVTSGVGSLTVVEDSGIITRIEDTGDMIIVTGEQYRLDGSPDRIEIILDDDPADKMLSFISLARQYGIIFLKEQGTIIDATAPCLEAYNESVLMKAFQVCGIKEKGLISARDWYQSNRNRLIKEAMATLGKSCITKGDIEKWFVAESARISAAIKACPQDVGLLQFKGGSYALSQPQPDRV